MTDKGHALWSAGDVGYIIPYERNESEDGGEEAVAPRVPPVPSKPTQAEQDEHHATCHAACRSWCEHYVRGRGRVSPHVSVPEGELPEIGIDCAYMGPEGSQVTILVCICKRVWQRHKCQRKA